MKTIKLTEAERRYIYGLLILEPSGVIVGITDEDIKLAKSILSKLKEEKWKRVKARTIIPFGK